MDSNPRDETRAGRTTDRRHLRNELDWFALFLIALFVYAYSWYIAVLILCAGILVLVGFLVYIVLEFFMKKRNLRKIFGFE